MGGDQAYWDGMRIILCPNYLGTVFIFYFGGAHGFLGPQFCTRGPKEQHVHDIMCHGTWTQDVIWIDQG